MDEPVTPLPIPPPAFPLPAGERAWQDRFTRRELRRRLYRCAGRLGVLVGGYVLAFLAAGVSATYLSSGTADLIVALLAMAMLAAVPWVVASVVGVLAVVRMWYFLMRYPWRAYKYSYLRIGDGAVAGAQLTVTDEDGSPRYLVIVANRRRESLRGMVTDEVWIAGTLRHGVLVTAGGGELFLSRLDRGRERRYARYIQRASRPRKPTRPRRPPKPRKPPKARQLSPEKQARAAEKARKRARAQAAARARLAQRDAERRQRRQRNPLTALRGQRGVGRPTSSLSGRRLLGQDRGGLFKKK